MAQDASFMPPVETIPFSIPDQLREDIVGLLAAVEAGDESLIAAWREEVWGSARMCPPEQDAWIRAHYVTGCDA